MFRRPQSKVRPPRSLVPRLRPSQREGGMFGPGLIGEVCLALVCFGLLRYVPRWFVRIWFTLRCFDRR